MGDTKPTPEEQLALDKAKADEQAEKDRKADELAKARAKANTKRGDMIGAGIVSAGRAKVKLYLPGQDPADATLISVHAGQTSIASEIECAGKTYRDVVQWNGEGERPGLPCWRGETLKLDL